MKVSYDAEGDLLCLVVGDDSAHQNYKELSRDILAGYGEDGNLVSLLIFRIKPSLPAGECLNDFVMTLQTTTEAVTVEVPQETFDGIMARVREAAAIAPAGKTGQSRP
ncbi:MAG: hypothetical protein AAB289_13660 [Chloroflexota bacterium]